jgi:hypothetical protein
MVKWEDLRSENLNALLTEHASQSEITLDLRRSATSEAFATGIFLASLSQLQSTLLVRLPQRKTTELWTRNLERSLLRALLWRSDEWPSTTTRDGAALSERPHQIGEGMLCVSTAVLSSSSPVRFNAQLASYLHRAGIQVPGMVLGSVAAIGFEACSNAEEHGAFRGANDTAGVMRFAAAFHHPPQPDRLDADATAYTRTYLERFSPPEQGWLEIFVIDAGPGMTYPSFYLMARESKWEGTDIYRTEYGVERVRLQTILESDVTTKGKWGRSLNTFTRPGYGTKVIKIRLALARGYAALRTGRAFASWSCMLPNTDLTQRDALPAFAVSENARALFRGTAWQVVVPITKQLELSL